MADAVKMISESTVTAESNYRGDECDLAVVISPDNATLKKAWSLLQPGGSIYIEWVLNPFSRIISIKRRLEAIGFRDITFYIPIPDPADFPSSVVWIPLAKHVVMDYLTKNSHENRNENVLKQLGKGLRQFLLLLSPELFISFPWLISSGQKKFKLCSIASKSSANDIITKSTPMNNTEKGSFQIKNIPEIIQNCLKNLNLHYQSKEISILMLTERGGFEKAIMFVFAGLSSKPAFVIKAPKTDEAESSLMREAEVLSALQKGLNAIEGVPKILFDGYKSGVSLIGESFIDGTPLSQIITQANYKELAMKMTIWLLELAEKTRTSSAQDLRTDYKNSILSRFIKSYKPVLNPMQIKQISDVLDKLELEYRVCVHNDLGLWNILIKSDGSMGIIDWEVSNLTGYPLTDLIMFLLWMSFQREGTYTSQQYSLYYRGILDSSTFTGKVFSECLEYYACKLMIPLEDFPAFRLLTLLIQADIEYPHVLSNMRESDKVKMPLDNGFYIQLIKEELRCLSKVGMT